MFSEREAATVLGLSVGRLRTYLKAGIVSPAQDDGGKPRLSFQDLALLRKAEGLVTSRIAPRRVRYALQRLRERLPSGSVLSGVQLSAEGRDVVVCEGERRWHPSSGQVVFAFDTAPADAEEVPVADLRLLRAELSAPPANDTTVTLSARDHYERGCALEEANPKEAMTAYREALAVNPLHADSHVNLGRLLHEGGDPQGALVHYNAAMGARPGDATAAFNLGVALEDVGRLPDAIEAYEVAIAVDPSNADAHYNLARLFEQDGKAESAIRHLLIYRRLTRKRER